MGREDYRPEDARGLIHEAYAMEIGPEDCRSIFLDWALGQAEGADHRGLITRLLDHYGTQAPDHPMTAVLREGLDQAERPPARRGGRRGRQS